MNLLARLIRAAEARPFHPLLMTFAAAWVTGVRYLEEKAFIYDSQRLPFDDRGTLIAWFCFYLALGHGIAAILTHLARVEWRRAMQAVAFGLTLAVLPPLVDVLIYGVGNFSYRYQKSFFTDTTFLLFNSKTGLPIGEGLIVWGSIVLVGLYTWLKSRRVRRSLVAAGLMYSFSLLYGVLIPMAALSLKARPFFAPISDKSLLAWAGLLIALIAYLVIRPRLARELLPRVPQVALGPAIVLLGSAWAGQISVHTFVAALAFSGATAVFALSNKHYDQVEDSAQGLDTSVQADDATALYVWALVLALSLWSSHLFVAVTLLLFLLASYAYQADPFRTKCIFPLSYKSEGFFAASALVAGLLARPGSRLDGHDALVIFLVFGGFFLSAPFKDAKDVEGDREAGVQTLYVVCLRRGWSFASTHLLASVLLASCLAVPVVFLATSEAELSWVVATATIALLAVGATALPWRRLGVALTVSSISAYCVVLAMGLLSRPT